MKKYGKWAAIGFVLFYVLSQPTNAADVVKSAMGGLASAATSMSRFVNALG